MSQPLSMKPLLINAEEMRRYSLGPGHPMGPDRVKLALNVAEYFHMLDLFDIYSPQPLSTALLQLVHTREYIEATRAEVAAKRFGLGTDDNPISHGLSTVASCIAAGTVEAARAVWQGETRRAVNLAGGLHHAAADRMEGFCMYNDAAIAIRWLLEQGATRIAYIDLDAHHGDGVEKIFWDDPRVLTISVHESGIYLYPHTGYAHEIGGQGAQGTAVNLALSKNADDSEWLQGIHSLIPALLKQFRPELLVTQHGADPHRADPLADLEVSIDAMAHAYRSLAVWADQYAGGKWVALGGGGYTLDSVARAWTQLLAAVAGVELEASASMPNGWDGSLTLGDAGVTTQFAEYDPKRVLTSRPSTSLIQTSRAVFPYWGIQPYG
ncbi:acetoin dehydrogenase [Corynebacterium riegelii]|uniref:Acetoin utilization protein AcuC n=2 Tax=Corynebacterium riegelii TaxID=156976 RepID=A0A0K1RAD1_9CORY|nr:acetoin dehydrogenase [Corynebacterium riegelii]PLA13602.1 acetoin utilization protein AcuC [Corynebacterium riegelii]QQU83567.1 acetoin utilization protein AcuC [Corynebacterium riegelii]